MTGVGPDESLFLWTLGWDVHALSQPPLRLFDANIFFPESGTLAYSENLLGTALLVTPVILATGNLVLALNVAILGSYVLCGIGAWVLARRVGATREAALLAGVIFAFAPPHFFRYGQIHQAAVQWMPLCLACVHAYGSSPRWLLAAAACVLFLLQAFASAHAGVFLSFAVAGLVVFLLATRQWPPLSRTFRDFGLPGLAVIGAVWWLATPYIQARDAGLQRPLSGLADASANGASLLAAATHVQQRLLELAGHSDVLGAARTYLFPGWCTLALGALTLLYYRKLASIAGYYFGLAMFGLWMSLGPTFGLYRSLYHVIPGLDVIRVPSRFGVLMLLGLAILAALGFDAALGDKASRVRRASAAVLLCLLVAEFAAFPIAAPHFAIEVPAVDRWLNGRAGAVVDLPVADPSAGYFASARHTRAMLHSTAHWLPLVNGYSGWASPRQEDLFRALASFPDERSLAALESIGVMYAVVHPGDYRPGEWRRAERGFRAFEGDRLRLEYVADGGRIYSLVRARKASP